MRNQLRDLTVPGGAPGCAVKRNPTRRGADGVPEPRPTSVDVGERARTWTPSPNSQATWPMGQNSVPAYSGGHAAAVVTTLPLSGLHMLGRRPVPLPLHRSHKGPRFGPPGGPEERTSDRSHRPTKVSQPELWPQLAGGMRECPQMCPTTWSRPCGPPHPKINSRWREGGGSLGRHPNIA